MVEKEKADDAAKSNKPRRKKPRLNKLQEIDYPQRGALLVVMKPSSPSIAAGSSFSISVTITNPFDVPVKVMGISTLLPVDLYDVNQVERAKQQVSAQKEIAHLRSELLREVGIKTVTVSSTFDDFFSAFFRFILNFVPSYVGLFDKSLQKLIGYSSSALATAIESRQVRKTPVALKLNLDYLSAEISQEVPRVSKTTSQEERQEMLKKVDDALKPLENEIERISQSETLQPVVIYPGDSVTNVFVLRTKKGITFQPTSYSLDVTLKYEVDSTIHNQTIPYTLDIQASQTSVIVGAVIGSIFGVLATETINLFDGQWPTVLPRAITTIIISAFAVIAFARKAGVQPIIAVQDIWGGLLIGFLVGYSGTQVLGNLFNNPTTNSVIAPTPTPLPPS